MYPQAHREMITKKIIISTIPTYYWLSSWSRQQYGTYVPMSVRSGGLASTSKHSGGGTGVPNRLVLAAKSGTHYLCTESTYDITPPGSAFPGILGTIPVNGYMSLST